jgi:hypothetical protein
MTTCRQVAFDGSYRMGKLPPFFSPQALEGQAPIGVRHTFLLPTRKGDTWALLPLKQEKLQVSVQLVNLKIR